MGKNPLYGEYLRFLHQQGADLAAALPRIADHLSAPGLDPDVERLLEAIAFNTAKIAHRRDRALVEVCEVAFDVLFPHYLLPVPACAIVAFEQPKEAPPQLIPRGTTVTSLPVMGTQCRFSTAFEVELAGAEVLDVRYRAAPRGGWLDVTLSLGSWLSALGPDRLRFHLHGEPMVSRTLFKGLLAHLKRVSVQGGGRSMDVTGGIEVVAAGLGEQEALLDYPPGSFAGFRLLQEYFAFPERFLFLDVLGLRAALAGQPARKQTTLRFELAVDRGEMVVGKQHLRLNCTPVVNLFTHAADPIRRNPRRTDHRARPTGPHLHYEVYRVLEVSGRSSGQVLNYPLLSDLERVEGRPHAQVFRRVHDGENHFHLSLYDGDALPPARQIVLIDILATNGKLPMVLGIGDINELWGDYPQVAVKNITAVTRPLASFSGRELTRRLVTHLALGQQDLVEHAALRDAFDLYDFGADATEQRARAHRLLLQALVSAKTELVQCLQRGTPVWGRATELVVDEESFDTTGDVYLLGVVLNEYIALQTPLNHYSDVTLRFARSLETHRWPKRLGRHLLSES